MRQHFFAAVCLGGAVLASGCRCAAPMPRSIARSTASNIIDEANLNEIMLAAADPAEAVGLFQSCRGRKA